MGILCKVILNIWTRYKDFCDITGSKQTKLEAFLVRVYLYLDLKYTAEKSVRIRGYSGLHFPELELNVERRSISPYSVRMREITDQNNSDYGHFSRSSTNQKKSPYLKGPTKNCFSQHVDEYSMLMFKSFILCNFWVSPYFIFVIIGEHEISSYFRVCSGFVQVFF